MCVLAFASCSKDLPGTPEPNEGTPKEPENYAQSVLGTSFDVNQDYNMLSSGQISITADLEESVGYKSGEFEVSKIQILSGNPFYEDDATVLNETAAKKGETVTLNYDAPFGVSTLYAAIVSTDNRYRVKAFTTEDATLSFGGKQQAKARRATVAAPEVTSEGRKSQNTLYRENGQSQWRGSYWNDKLYEISATVEDLEDFNNAERKEVDGVINKFTPEKVDNRNAIRQTDFYINTANYFTTTGKPQPIMVTPVHSGASIIDSENMYYYYFNPADVEGMTDSQRAEYMQKLPKYHLLSCNGWRNGGHWQFTRRAHRYTLAYFGDEEPTTGTKGSYEFPAGYKIGFMLYGTYGKTVELYADSLLNNEVNYYEKWAEAHMGQNMSRAAIFGANGKNYIGWEDAKDNDFNDVVFCVEGGVEVIDESKLIDKGIYTYAFEDTEEEGDYDMNDVVIKAQRIDATHVKFSLEATGAWDEVYIKTTGSLKLGKLQDAEVHSLFNTSKIQQFVNTEKNAAHIAPIQETVEVPSNFSFGNQGKNIYIYNKTKNKDVKLAEKGEDPHGILIPYDWKYPLEKMCVTDAYETFNNWGASRVDNTTWYKTPREKVEDHVYLLSVFK